MPGFDGTGPGGMGPMTGGMRGFCGTGGRRPRGYRFPRRFGFDYPDYRPLAVAEPYPSSMDWRESMSKSQISLEKGTRLPSKTQAPQIPPTSNKYSVIPEPCRRLRDEKAHASPLRSCSRRPHVI